MMTKTISRILIVDDHSLVREGLAGRIDRQDDMQVCGEAESVDEALALVKEATPNVLIIDIQLSESHGIDLIKEVHSRFPSVKMLVVSAFDESLFAERALRAGAHGYLNKRELHGNVVKALRTVMDGGRYLSQEMTQKLVGQAICRVDPGQSDPVLRLSDRELQVFCLIGQGKTTGAIARQLHLSPHTIDSHREKIRNKLGLNNSAELTQSAVQWVLENGA